MKIYTRTGDEGETGLFGGRRVRKESERIAAYGEVDELNSALGWCATAAGAELAVLLRREQARLFVLGAWLATPSEVSAETRSHLPAWHADAFEVLEAEIDRFDASLAPLRTFILPGGTEAAARLHLARTICRRAERAVAALANDDYVDPRHQAYLNRLSDWLFVLAREANRAAGVPDEPWRPAAGTDGAAGS